MKIKVKNLGVLRQAEFELGDLTILCGPNNSGKTYATYALFGFLSYWRERFFVKVPQSVVTKLLNDGVAVLNLDEYIGKSNEIVKEGCKEYVGQLPNVFALSEKAFSDSSFMVELIHPVRPVSAFEQTMGTARTQLFSISKEKDRNEVTVTLLVEKDKAKTPYNMVTIRRVIGDALKSMIFGKIFPKPFIASAERTGAAIFRKELDFARNRLLEQMSSMGKEIDPFELLTRTYADYALPVRTNVDFIRQLEDVSKRESFIQKNHSELLTEFEGIIGGRYQISRGGELNYSPKGKNIRLTMGASSSAVRSLLDVGFYLRHEATPGDLLMIDEPELNLHPTNQRRVARLLARLVNLGIKVFITTHSDYIVKELNTLIMLNQDKPHIKQIAEREKYKKEELLASNQIRVFMAEEDLLLLEGGKRRTPCQTLTPASIDPVYGIEARTFDDTINEMNRIQDEIVWGGSEDG